VVCIFVGEVEVGRGCGCLVDGDRKYSSGRIKVG